MDGTGGRWPPCNTFISAHDFFSPQPVQNPSIFLVRTICHDWPDELVVKILSNLRSAAGKSTRLIVADYVIPYACTSDNLELKTASSSNSPATLPLLENLGKAGFNAYYIDMTVSLQMLLMYCVQLLTLTSRWRFYWMGKSEPYPTR